MLVLRLRPSYRSGYRHIHRTSDVTQIVFFVSASAELITALFAYKLAVEHDDIVCISTENTCRYILFQHNSVFVRKNFDRIPRTDVHNLSDLDRQHDTPQLIDSLDHSCGFHIMTIPFLAEASGGFFPSDFQPLVFNSLNNGFAWYSISRP